MSDKARAERLKAALRENLKKRKAQARSRGEAGENPGGGAGDARPAEESGGAATEAHKAED